MSGAVILHSGGLDSTVLLYHIIKNLGFDVKNVVSLSIGYGQRHVRELSGARKVCARLGIKHIEVNLPIEKLISNSALINKQEELPRQHYTHENQRITVVPNRNMILLSLAIAYAENLGIKDVFYAAHKNDYAVYPDCRPEFIRELDKASQFGTYAQVRVKAPFVDMYKKDIVGLGLRLGVPFELTWSCYVGGRFPCSFEGTKSYEETLGKGCATCQERNEAFLFWHKIDPLYKKYQEEFIK